MGKIYNTIEEIINDPQFRANVKSQMEELKTKRIGRPELKGGYRYKKDWFDRMMYNNRLNPEYFLENIGAIWDKKSTLTSKERYIIQVVCNSALIKTVKNIQNANTH